MSRKQAKSKKPKQAAKEQQISKEDLLAVFDGLSEYMSNMESDDALIEKIEKTSSPEEIQKLFSNLLMTGFQLAAISPKDPRFLQLLDQGISSTTKALTELSLRVMTKEELAARLPATLKTEASIRVLHQLGLNNLADICMAGDVCSIPDPNTQPKKSSGPQP